MTASLKPTGVVLWLLGPCVLGLSLWRPVDVVSQRGDAFPTQLAGFEVVEKKQITAKYVRLLGTRDALWWVFQERDRDGGVVYVTCIFHENNWKSLHPPHICLRGSNMDIRSDRSIKLRVGEREVTVGRVLADNRRTNQAYLGLYAFVGDDFVTESYLGFFLQHAPRALFRSATPGFLIRVETYVGAGEDEAAAEARCRRFLSAAIPAGEALIR